MAETTTGWQPIATAPVDGTWVMLAGGDITYGWDGNTKPLAVVGQRTKWLNGSERDEPCWQFAWYDGGFYGEYEAPTHWMPLPAPPDAALAVPEEGREP